MTRRGYIMVGLSAGVAVAVLLGVLDITAQKTAPLHATETGARISSLARALRPNYPYSVIPGGAYSPAELRSALDRDALVRGHYSGFDLNRLKLVRLNQDHYSFVSYRKDNRLFWTRRRLKIPSGEILLTDGRNYAKTRCGNRLSETPVKNAASSEVSDDVLSPPPIEEGRLANLQFVPAPVAGEISPRLTAKESQPAMIAALMPQTVPAGFGGMPVGGPIGGFGGPSSGGAGPVGRTTGGRGSEGQNGLTAVGAPGGGIPGTGIPGGGGVIPGGGGIPGSGVPGGGGVIPGSGGTPLGGGAIPGNGGTAGAGSTPGSGAAPVPVGGSINPLPIPEPATELGMFSALSLLLFWSRRRVRAR